MCDKKSSFILLPTGRKKRAVTTSTVTDVMTFISKSVNVQKNKP